MFTSQPSASQSKLRIPSPGGDKERIVPCTVRSLRDGRLQITTSEQLPSGSAVSVEHEDALMLGEVLVSVPKPHAWHIEIRVEHLLNGLMNLMALRDRLLQEKPGRSPAIEQHAGEENEVTVPVRPWKSPKTGSV